MRSLVTPNEKMKIHLYDDHLRINLSILEKIGAAKGSFHIPYSNIVSAFSEPPHNLSGLKVAGTNLPKVLEIGTYLAGTQKQFWYVKKRRHSFSDSGPKVKLLFQDYNRVRKKQRTGRDNCRKTLRGIWIRTERT